MADSLDRIDRRLLALLQADGRLSVAELGRRVHLSPTPCFERVRRLEREGYIRGYAADLDPAKLGAGLIAFVEVQLDRTTPDVFNRFRDGVIGLEPVQECHMVAGGFDYLLKVRTGDMGAYRRFLEELAALAGVEQTHTYVVMEEVKSTRAIPIDER
ncbi:MAG TPA: Lrp/AsnC ligand binding domain-containing protein [Steroidobacteraceae bacterium]|nr:Lrp/AsnC ligand binding domain-containing protein [Steroidobacteraceae bacterium]